MKFNSFDGVSEQEVILMKKAIKKLQEPKTESKTVTIPLGETVTVDGGPYRGFECKIAASYAGIVTATIGSWAITLQNGDIYKLSDGVLFNSNGTHTTMSTAPELHSISKYATFDEIEFSVAGAPGTPGIEFDLVMLK